MELTTAIIENIIKVDNCWEDNAEYIIDSAIALTHQQIIELNKMFQMQYGLIHVAYNFGTVYKFDVVIKKIHFRITPENEPAFKELLCHILPAHYPTENNFLFFINPDWPKK